MNAIGEYRLPLLEFFTGETQRIIMHELDNDTHQPLDLTGATAIFIVCYFEDKTFPLFTKTGTISQDRSGRVEFLIQDEDTENLEEGSYLVQRELVLPNGMTSIIEGEWFLRKGV